VSVERARGLLSVGGRGRFVGLCHRLGIPVLQRERVHPVVPVRDLLVDLALLAPLIGLLCE
jgi:hypothetical protein